MKKYFFTILLLASFSMLTYADSFQFYYRSSGSSSVYAAYQSVKLYDASNRLVFSGYTDKFGRIAIKVNPGNYSCAIMYQQKEYKVGVTIDNRSDFKMVYFGTAAYMTKRF